MFASISVEGLGPFGEVYAVGINGERTDFRLPSQAGKSTIIDAICWALWGKRANGKPMPQTAISDECEMAVVKLTTGAGTVIERRMDRKRAITRIIEKPGEPPDVYSREADFAAALHIVGTESARLVLAPMAWRQLAEGAGNGRPLRDLLAKVLVKGDGLRLHVDRLLDGNLQGNDPINPIAVEGMRRNRRKESDRKAGARNEAVRALDAMGGPDAEAGDVDGVRRAQSVMRWNTAWQEYDGEKRVEHGWLERLRQWQARHDDIPTAEGTWDVEAYNRAKDTLHAVEQQRGAAANGASAATAARAVPTAALVEATHQRNAAAAAVDKARESGLDCPTCGKRWAKAGNSAARAADVLAEAQNVVHAASLAADVAREAESGARIALTDVDKRIAKAKANVGAASAGKARADALSALGEKPNAPTVPEPPKKKRPSEQKVADAMALIAKWGQVKGAADERKRQLASAKQRLRTAESQAATALAEAERMEALLVAVRKAPSLALADALVAFTLFAFDNCPVDVVLPKVGDGVDVLIDDRPWDAASTGRQVYADAVFRHLLRRALGMEWFPICIDNATAWSEGLPDVAPCIVMHTVKP